MAKIKIQTLKKIYILVSKTSVIINLFLPD